MRQSIDGYPVIRDLTVGGDDKTMTVVADGEFLYVPQIVTIQRDRLAYYLEITKRLLQEGVGTIDD